MQYLKQHGAIGGPYTCNRSRSNATWIEISSLPSSCRCRKVVAHTLQARALRTISSRRRSLVPLLPRTTSVLSRRNMECMFSPLSLPVRLFQTDRLFLIIFLCACAPFTLESLETVRSSYTPITARRSSFLGLMACSQRTRSTLRRTASPCSPRTCSISPKNQKRRTSRPA